MGGRRGGRASASASPALGRLGFRLLPLICLILQKLLRQVGEVLAVVKEELLADFNISESGESNPEVAVYVQDLGRDVAAALVALGRVVDVSAQVAVDGRVDPDAFLLEEGK